MSPLLLFPDFAIIALGYALRQHWMPANQWAVIERLVYFVLFPCLLFHSVVSSPLDFQAVGVFALGGVFVIGCGFLLGVCAQPWARMNRVDFASGLQVCYRFNSYIALALAGRVGGSAAVANMAILLAVGVPLCNMLAVGSMSDSKASGVALEMAKNPLILGTLGGVLFKLIGLPLPEPISLTLGRIAPAAVALGLMAVGSGLVFSGIKGNGYLSIWFLSIKLLAAPALAVLYAQWMGLDAMQSQVLLVFSAIPTASSAYILATRMGGNGPWVACLISLSTVLAALTIAPVFELAKLFG